MSTNNESAAPKLPRIGELVADRYKLLKVIGAGGMGAVYKCQQANLGRTAAIKMLLPSVSLKKSARRRFEREAKVAAALRHRNAVEIYDFGEDPFGRLYLVMEYLQGTTLRSYVDEDLPPMDWEKALPIAYQIADVLVAAHRLGLVHRDLKPENIFLEKQENGQDRAVVVDFGLAFMKDREDTRRMTKEGIVVGTPDYISPEQASGKPVDAPTDIYALGCILYEIATTRVPFLGDQLQMLTQHLFKAPTPPSQILPSRDISTRLEELILAMLAKKPLHRPPAEEVRLVLKQEMDHAGERERGRDANHLLGRAARMIPEIEKEGREAKTMLTAPPSFEMAELEGSEAVLIVGEVTEDLLIGLSANNYRAVSGDGEEIRKEVVAIYAPGASTADLERLLRHNKAVITDTEPTDMERVSSLLHLGVDEVIPKPVGPDDLARRASRAIKKRKRHERRQRR